MRSTARQSARAAIVLSGISASLAICAGWTAALAQSIHEPARVTLAPPPSTETLVDPLTVEALPKPEVIREETPGFVQTHAATNPKIDQIARWHSPICVELVGLPTDQAAQVIAHIENAARTVQVKVLKSGCSANIQIEFTDQPQQLLDEVADRAEPLLGYHDRGSRDKVKTVTRPIQAWYATSTVGGTNVAGAAFGGAGTGSNFGSVPGLTTQTELLDSPDIATPSGCAENPRLTACLKSTFAHVLMVADRHAIEGKDLGVVADYIAMLALSQPKSLDECSPLPSVLDTFAGATCPARGRPHGLTPADSAYLRALYASDSEEKMRAAEGDIAGRMADILTKASRTANP